MDMSKMLAGRVVQPGSKPFGKPAHEAFESVILKAFPQHTLVSEPRFFKQKGYWAMVPDFSLAIGSKVVFFEVKRQGAGGNAHERLYKNFTTKKMLDIMSSFGLDHYPHYGILCDELATNPRYTREFAQNLEDENYLLWANYDPQTLVNFILRLESEGAGIDLDQLA